MAATLRETAGARSPGGTADAIPAQAELVAIPPELLAPDRVTGTDVAGYDYYAPNGQYIGRFGSTVPVKRPTGGGGSTGLGGLAPGGALAVSLVANNREPNNISGAGPRVFALSESL